MNFKLKFEELFGIDLRSLAAFRILLAFIYLCDLSVRFRDFKVLYTDFGLLPRITHLQTYQDPWIFSLNMMSGAAPIQILLFIIAAIAGTALLVGYRTRIATVIAWLMILSLDARNPLVLGEGVFIRIFLFWGMFLPLGACCSVDSTLNSSPEKKPPQFLSMATVALLIQVALVFFCSAGHKLQDQGWREGWALFNSLNYDPLTKPLGYFLLHFQGLTKFLTYSTMWFELIGPLLLFSPFFTIPVRLAMIFGFIALQLGFLMFLELGPLPWSIIVGIIPFFPAAFWDYCLEKLKPGRTFCETICNYIAQNRVFRKRFISHFQPSCVKLGPSKFGTFLVTIFFLYMLFSNWSSFSHVRIPYGIQRVGKSMLWMDQYWNMFSPPPRTGGWNVIEGRQKKGTSVDLLNQGKPISWQKPPLISATFKSQLWRKYWMRILNTGYEIPRSSYAQYLCREWNGRHSGQDQLNEIELFQMQTQMLPNYQVTKPKKISYGKYSC